MDIGYLTVERDGEETASGKSFHNKKTLMLKKMLTKHKTATTLFGPRTINGILAHAHNYLTVADREG